MSKTVLLVGHCGPDSSYLKMIVKKAITDAHIISIDDSRSFTQAMETIDPALILFNRELGYGFDPATGVEAIALLRQTHPNLKMILVSNYADAQKAAEAAGALPGFGKNELGSPRVLEVLRDAVGVEVIK
jgi:DNA-binding NarL/FixJ family response regulator